jgi:hypothetical protein
MEETTMSSPQNKIRLLVSRWYGMIGMPLRVLPYQQEVDEYEKAHPEVPPELWQFVDHKLRLSLLWMREDVDIVVRLGDGYTLVQDLIFRDQYDSVEAWHKACRHEIMNNPEVWIVYHEDS